MAYVQRLGHRAETYQETFPVVRYCSMSSAFPFAQARPALDARDVLVALGAMDNAFMGMGNKARLEIEI